MRQWVRLTALSLAMGTGNVYALNLGEMALHSKFNQPFQAEIDIVNTAPGTSSGLRVGLAPRDVFLRTGIDRSPVLDNLQFSMRERGNGQPYVAITSAVPIDDPFLNFLVLADAADGSSIVREYTVLLDPPEYMPTAGVQTSAAFSDIPTPVAAESYLPSAIERQAQEPGQGAAYFDPDAVAAGTSYKNLPVVQLGTPPSELLAQANTEVIPPPTFFSNQPESNTSVSTSAAKSSAPRSLTVQRNQRLWDLALKIKPSGATHQQTMVALLRENPKAFIRGNMNLVKAGAILRVPEAEQILAISQQQALAVIREQKQSWISYRQRGNQGRQQTPTRRDQTGAGQQRPIDRTPVADTGASPGSQGKTEPAADPDLVLLSEAARTGKGDAVATEAGDKAPNNAQYDARIALLEEELVAERQTNAELQQRIDELESLVSNLQRLVEIDNADLANLQQSAAEQNNTAGTPAQFGPGSVPESLDNMTPSNAGQVMRPEPEMPMGGDLMASNGDLSTTASDLFTPNDLTPVDNEAAISNPFETPQPSLMQSLLSGTAPLFLGLGAVSLLGWVAWRRRRNTERQAVSDDFAMAAAGANAATSDPAFDDIDDLPEPDSVASWERETSEQANHAAIPVAAPAPAEIRDNADNDGEGTLSEAEVYMSYELYDRAIDVLESLSQREPGREDIAQKLTEAYHGAGQKTEFQRAAQNYLDRFGSQSPGWARIMDLGQQMAPSSPLFGGSDGASMMSSSTLADESHFGHDELDVTQIVEHRDGSADHEFNYDPPEDLTNEREPRSTGLRDADLNSDIDALDLEDLERTLAADELEDLPTSKHGGLDFDLTELEDTLAEFEKSPPAQDDLRNVTPQPPTLAESPHRAGDNGADLTSTLALDDGNFDLSEFNMSDESETMLDLARAYIEMGDSDSARSALTEILNNGNTDQQSAARELLQAID